MSRARMAGFGVIVGIGSLVIPGVAHAQGRGPETIRLMLPQRPGGLGTVGTVDAAGVVRLAVPPVPGAPTFTEGYYLLLIRPEVDSDPMTLIRAQVTEIGEEGRVTAQVARAATAAIKSGQDVVLVRPVGSTTAQLRAVPEIIRVAVGGDVDGSQAAARLKSVNNLKQIMLALHNFESANGHFPPAVVYGPDGKPWHSWRVLILPYLEQADLYNQYDFGQPWDSEQNKKVLDQMPAVYRDPLNGDAKGNATHYAVAVGKHTLFPPEGAKIEDPEQPTFNGPGATRIAMILDGTSNTLAVGPVAPDKKIPWTKPEDIPFGDDLSSPEFSIGGAKGFAAPVKTKGADGKENGAAPLAFADGSVRIIASTIQRQVLDALMTRDGGEVVAFDAIPAVGDRARMVPVLTITREGGQAKARIVEEAAPQPEPAETTIVAPPGRAVIGLPLR